MNILSHTKVPWIVVQEKSAATNPLRWGALVLDSAPAARFSRQRTKVLHPSGFFFVCAPQGRHATSNGTTAADWPKKVARGNGGDRVEPGWVVKAVQGGFAFYAPTELTGSMAVKSALRLMSESSQAQDAIRSPIHLGWGDLRHRTGKPSPKPVNHSLLSVEPNSERIVAWRDLPEPAKGFFQNGMLYGVKP